MFNVLASLCCEGLIRLTVAVFSATSVDIGDTVPPARSAGAAQEWLLVGDGSRC